MVLGRAVIFRATELIGTRVIIVASLSAAKRPRRSVVSSSVGRRAVSSQPSLRNVLKLQVAAITTATASFSVATFTSTTIISTAASSSSSCAATKLTVKRIAFCFLALSSCGVQTLLPTFRRFLWRFFLGVPIQLLQHGFRRRIKLRKLLCEALATRIKVINEPQRQINEPIIQVGSSFRFRTTKLLVLFSDTKKALEKSSIQTNRIMQNHGKARKGNGIIQTIHVLFEFQEKLKRKIRMNVEKKRDSSKHDSDLLTCN